MNKSDVLGNWSKQGTEGLDVIKIIGYDEMTRTCKIFGKNDTKTIQDLGRDGYRKSGMPANPYIGMDMGTANGDLKTDKIAADDTMVIEKIEDVSTPEPIVKTDKTKQVVIGSSATAIEPKNQKFIQSAIDLMKTESCNKIDITIPVNVEFDMKKVIDMAKMANVSNDELAAVMIDNIKINTENLSDGLVQTIKDIIKAPTIS